DEVQALLLLSSLLESWSGTATVKGHFQNQCSKPVTSKDKEVNKAARDYDGALVCCFENTIDDHIMDYGESFHTTYYKEELKRFKLRSGKVHLADDKTLDIAGVGGVVLKTSFGTSWNLKDVRYIPGLKKRLISIGQLDEEGYHVGFGDQQWKVTKGNLVVARGNKRGSLYMVEVPSDGINAAIDVKGNTALWHQTLGHMSEKVKVKDVARDKLDAKSMKCTFIGYGSDEMGYRFWDLKSHKVVRSRDVIFNEDSLYGAKAATDSSNLTKPNQKDQVVLEDSLENLANKSIVTEHGLSSEITQSPGGSSYTSEGSENSRSFKDSVRSDEEDSEDRASFEEEGSETPHVRRSTRESKAPVRYSPSANYLLL
ncbi:retrovirus-related pol polyprotein from transposon TNT 1-94, partial [Tanacetum coccineum]